MKSKAQGILIVMLFLAGCAGGANYTRETKDRNHKNSDKTIVISSIGYRMAYIPPGDFLMGSPSSDTGSTAGAAFK